MSNMVRCGFLPLVDAALPILARELGFAEAEGIDLVLVKDMSWASVRDRLIYGHSDVAHLPAPLAIATALGLDRPAVDIGVPFVLGLNGNAITMRADLARSQRDGAGPTDAAKAGQRLAGLLKTIGRRPRFGVVHRYSSHNYMLRYWLTGCGIDPNRDVEIVTIAPPFAADALAAGEVDGICVGEPWNSVAVARGAGEIVVTTSQIWQRGVEKVLAARREWLDANAELNAALLRALWRAGAAFIDPEKISTVVEILARPEHVGGSAELIEHAVTDRIVFAVGEAPAHIPDFMFQHREAANFPWVSQAAWLYAQMSAAGHTVANLKDYHRATAVFRPDIYRSALRPTGAPIPGASAKLEGGIETPLGVGTRQGRLILGPDRFFDGQSFDADDYEKTLANPA